MDSSSDAIKGLVNYLLMPSRGFLMQTKSKGVIETNDNGANEGQPD